MTLICVFTLMYTYLPDGSLSRMCLNKFLKKTGLEINTQKPAKLFLELRS